MGVTEFLAEYITAFIQYTGYISVCVLMVMESMILPVPSEAVMPFAGWLIATNDFTWFGVIFFSTLGSIIGSLLSYWIGKYGGKPFVERFGKFVLLDMHELEATERFFKKYGELTILISRFIPVIRHLISIPAGVGRMNLWKFSIFTIIGAGMWNTILTIVGYFLQQNWNTVMKYSSVIDIVIAAIILALIGLFVYKQLRKRLSLGRQTTQV